jgi:hypothetical protein
MEAEFKENLVEETGEVIERNKLYLPVRKDSYGKLFCKLTSVFPGDFMESEYGSIVINTGAFKVKFINPNIPEEEVVKALEELCDKDVSVNVRFKMMKVSQGIKEVNLSHFVPDGKSGKGAYSSIVLPLSPAGFGDVSGKIERAGDETILHLPEGDIVFDFPINVEGKVTFSYGISQLVLREITGEGESSVNYNLLKMF